MRRTTRVILVALLATTACRPDAPTGVLPPGTVITISVSPDAAEVPVEGRLQLEAIVRDQDGEVLPGTSLEWASSDASRARVDERGEVTGVGLGSAAITASTNGVTGTADVHVRGFLIGPEGGEAVSEDGRARVEVPSGALSASVAVKLERATESLLPSGENDRVPVPGAAFELDAGAPSLAAPARLHIRYDPSSLPSDVPESTLRLYRVQNGQWVEVQGAQLDAGADQVRADVTTSGVFAAVGRRDLPPEVTIASPQNGSRTLWGQPVSFSGSATDRIDGALSGSALAWSSDRDGQLGTGGSFTRNNLSIGEHVITLSATNQRGRTGTAQVTIHVDNNPPVAQITNPNDGAVFFRNQPVQFRGTGDDPEDGRLQGNALVWSSNRDGDFGTGENATVNTLSTGDHTITLTARDSRGATGTAQIRIRILALF